MFQSHLSEASQMPLVSLNSPPIWKKTSGISTNLEDSNPAPRLQLRVIWEVICWGSARDSSSCTWTSSWHSRGAWCSELVINQHSENRAVSGMIFRCDGTWGPCRWKKPLYSRIPVMVEDWTELENRPGHGGKRVKNGFIYWGGGQHKEDKGSPPGLHSTREQKQSSRTVGHSHERQNPPHSGNGNQIHDKGKPTIPTHDEGIWNTPWHW